MAIGVVRRPGFRRCVTAAPEAERTPAPSGPSPPPLPPRTPRRRRLFAPPAARPRGTGRRTAASGTGAPTAASAGRTTSGASGATGAMTARRSWGPLGPPLAGPRPRARRGPPPPSGAALCMSTASVMIKAKMPWAHPASLWAGAAGAGRP
jgi:hypothetical protein